ncbi:hypothetical protein GALMADRAFT_598978 [Galerina marginata CBS 339.88]|uniref:F-box domain-containing protein n=1 Tax=Galerina marginata (strain CBS 339.88) TaxID=685588 RepID=A0A067T4V9_GALM3|nr:hypothetical protein GALMADRAFT_598978 [Galerina marginata CBS 339.88]
MNYSHNPIIQQIPTEIVACIFQLSIPERPSEVSSRSLSKNEIRAPLILGSVCQVWRQIAFSTPQIWTYISIYLEKKFRSATARPALYELAQEWLDRSGAFPLSVYIYGDRHTGGPNITPLIEIVNRCSSRWKHLELELPRSYVSRFTGNSSGTSILQSLRLRCEKDFPSLNPAKGSLTLHNVKPNPILVSLEDWPIKDVEIEWNHVTHIHLGYPDISECIEVLRRATKLTSFKFTEARDSSQISFNFIPYATPTTPIIRPLLRELYIDVKDIETHKVANFINSFTLPGLETFAFSSRSDWHTIPTSNIVLLFKRSACILSTLIIEKDMMDVNEILPLLQTIPSVRNLKFSSLLDAGVSSVLETLLSTISDMAEGAGHILPALETLSFSGENTLVAPFPWALVPKIFGPPPNLHRRLLRKLDISVSQDKDLEASLYIDEESIHRFLELREAGIALNIKVLCSRYDESTRVFHKEEWDLLKLSIEHHSNAVSLSSGPSS